ncbi:hypothetical protein [Streptomyces mirabilis]|uniref:hypothetical protein n=1 Tax=Streptomyces mirabilis TaxID=68239 RepID=UPI0036924F38
MNVDDVIRERIEAARRKAENDQRRRAELAAARTAGLAHRHAQKLRNLNRGETATVASATATDAKPSPSKETPMAPAALRAACCPACRRERRARLVTTVTVTGVPHDVLRCLATECELLWLVRAERPRTVPAAA